jgi:hypothetical protein
MLKGEFHGKSHEDKGKALALNPMRRVRWNTQKKGAAATIAG